MTDQVHLSVPLLVPQVNVQDVHRVVNIIEIKLNASSHICYYEADAWWWSNGSPIFVTKATHSCSLWLLHYLEAIFPISIHQGETGRCRYGGLLRNTIRLLALSSPRVCRGWKCGEAIVVLQVVFSSCRRICCLHCG